jgi:hypothetical protein
MFAHKISLTPLYLLDSADFGGDTMFAMAPATSLVPTGIGLSIVVDILVSLSPPWNVYAEAVPGC